MTEKLTVTEDTTLGELVRSALDAGTDLTHAVLYDDTGKPAAAIIIVIGENSQVYVEVTAELDKQLNEPII